MTLSLTTRFVALTLSAAIVLLSWTPTVSAPQLATGSLLVSALA